jgi:NTP pyrophosphohydrolases including oxidative damage repair enzymes
VIFRAKSGAEIIEKIQIDEFEAMKKYTSINHVLAIVKIENDYLMGWHKWRNDWETFGGLIESGEYLRECIYRECEEELGIKNVNFDYLGIVHYYMPPGYWIKEWHEEYGGLYGITLPREALAMIEQKRMDRDEIGEIAFYSDIKERGEKIDEINEKLLTFY